MTGRVLHAALHLLDHQLRARHGELCGKVDDLEIEPTDDGTWYVTAILTGSFSTPLSSRQLLPAYCPSGTFSRKRRIIASL